jgi:hypothetical protein
VESLDGRQITTVWDLMLWWIVLVPAAAIGGAYGVVTLGRRVREVQGWRQRSAEVTLRLQRARAEQERRGSVVQ